MIKKFLKKILLYRTKNCIENFIVDFSAGNTFHLNGYLMAKVAMVHHGLRKASSNFEKLVNSQKGENVSEITAFNVFQLDRLQKEFLKAHDPEGAAFMKFWSISMRCMISESFHGYGVELWEIASESFEDAENYLHNCLRTAIEMGNKEEVERIRGALSLCHFIPPQFRKENN